MTTYESNSDAYYASVTSSQVKKNQMRKWTYA